MANCFARTNGSRASWEIGSSSSSLIATTKLKINLYPISYFWNQWWSSLLVCQADHNIQVGFLPFLSTQLLEKTAPWAEKNSIRYASRFPIQNGILKYPVDFHLAMPQKRGKNVVKYDLNLMIEGTTTRCGVSTYVHLSLILSPRIHWARQMAIFAHLSKVVMVGLILAVLLHSLPMSFSQPFWQEKYWRKNNHVVIIVVCWFYRNGCFWPFGIENAGECHHIEK